MDDNRWQEDIARRLRALQQALQATNGEMAAHAGCGEKSWDSYVNARAELPPQYALNLQNRLGPRLEWFYNNDASRNPEPLQRLIDEALRNPVPPSRGRRSKKIKHPIHK